MHHWECFVHSLACLLGSHIRRILFVIQISIFCLIFDSQLIKFVQIENVFRSCLRITTRIQIKPIQLSQIFLLRLRLKVLLLTIQLLALLHRLSELFIFLHICLNLFYDLFEVVLLVGHLTPELLQLLLQLVLNHCHNLSLTLRCCQSCHCRARIIFAQMMETASVVGESSQTFEALTLRRIVLAILTGKLELWDFKCLSMRLYITAYSSSLIDIRVFYLLLTSLTGMKQIFLLLSEHFLRPSRR